MVSWTTNRPSEASQRAHECRDLPGRPSRSDPGPLVCRVPAPPHANPPPPPLVALLLLVAVSSRSLPPDRPPNVRSTLAMVCGEARPRCAAGVYGHLFTRLPSGLVFPHTRLRMKDVFSRLRRSGEHEEGAEVVPRPLLYSLLLTVSLMLHRTLSSYSRCSVACRTIVAHISKSLRLVQWWSSSKVRENSKRRARIDHV